MTTKADLLAGLRLRLNDVGTNPRWSDSELAAYLRAAAVDYSRYFPRERDQSFVADGIRYRYDVPGDLLDDRIIAIETVGELPGDPNRAIAVDQRRRLRWGTRWFEVVDEEIVFGWLIPAGTAVNVRYEAIHSIPETGDVTIPQEDEEIVYVAAMAMAWQRLAGNDAALSRWREQGRRDDSPVIPQHADLWARYRRMIEAKRSGIHIVHRIRRQWRRRLL